ncbi:hypothetical protein V8E36_009657 [Tilletia maclaganii]
MSFLIPTLASFLLPALALGPVPRHIAFIMDGNRRWATSHKTSIRSGHASGFEALKRVLESCLALDGLECITVYAFAIDNFKRSQEEVDALMELASSRLLELASHRQIIAKHCVRIRIIGRTDLLPAHVQAAVHKVESITKNNDKALLNICIPYAARDEMAAAVRSTLHNHLHSRLRSLAHDDDECEHDDWPPPPSEETLEQLLNERMMFTHSPPLDLIVRTSGVQRLSDFMLHQASRDNAQLGFVDCYWPQFGLRHLVPLLLDYQRGVWAGRRQSLGRVGASRRVGAIAGAGGRTVEEEPGRIRSKGTQLAASGKGLRARIRRRAPTPFVVLIFLASLLLLLARIVYELQLFTRRS